MQDISLHLQAVLQRIDQACRQAGRKPDAVQLLAVSKTRPASVIRAAYEAGLRHFGENYVQEALAKMAELDDLPLTWHLIGHLQSNKATEVANRFHWVHSVDRLKVAERLSAARSPQLPPLNICLQVNIDDEGSKSGCQVAALPALVNAVLALPNLALRGLMIIPRPGNDQAFAELVQIRQQLQQTIPELAAAQFDTLSMGMSADMEAAIRAGSTMVRVGAALFGVRAVKE